VGGEALLERLDAEPRVEERPERLRAEGELAGAEAPGVVEDQLVRPEDEPDSAVPPGRLRIEQERARHAQVREQIEVVLELPHQVLAATREALDAPPAQRRLDLGGSERPAPARVMDLDHI